MIPHPGARRVARNTAVLLIGSAGRMALSIVLQVLAARWLGAVGLGKYTLLLAFLNIFQTVCEFGLPSLTIREAARTRSTVTPYLYAAGVLQTLFAVVAWAGMIGLAALLRYPTDTQAMLLIGGASLLPYAFMSAAEAVLQAQERMTPVMALDLAGALLTVALNVTLLALGYGVLYLAVATVVTQVIQAAAAVVIMARLGQLKRIHWPGVLTRSLLRSAPAFFLLALAVAVFSRLDVLSLSRLRGEVAVGVYTAAFLVVNAANLAFASYGNAIYPRLAQLFAADAGRFTALAERVVGHALALSLPVAVGGTLLAPQIIQQISRSQQYASSAGVLRIVIWYAVPFALNTVFSRLLLSSNHQRQSVVVAVIKLAFGLVAYLLLIPRLGVEGAALATVLSAALGTAMNWAYVSRHIAAIPLLRLGWRSGLAALGMAGVLTILQANVILEVLTGATVYAGLLVLLGGVGAEDVAVLRGLVISRKPQ